MCVCVCVGSCKQPSVFQRTSLNSKHTFLGVWTPFKNSLGGKISIVKPELDRVFTLQTRRRASELRCHSTNTPTTNKHGNISIGWRERAERSRNQMSDVLDVDSEFMIYAASAARRHGPVIQNTTPDHKSSMSLYRYDDMRRCITLDFGYKFFLSLILKAA